MKHSGRFGVFLLTVVLMVSMIGTANGANLVSNGHFENGISPSVGYGASASISGSYYRGYNHSCRLAQTMNYGGLYIPVSLENGKTYAYKAWVRYDQGSSGGAGICMAFIASDGAVQTFLNATPELSRFDDWTCLKGTITMQQSLQNQYISIYANPGNGLQTFYVDNVDITEIPAS